MSLARSHLALAAAHPVWARLADEHGPCAIEAAPAQDPYQALFRAIVFQQLSGKAAETILGRVLALSPEPFPAPATLLATPVEALRAAGLSGAKTLALRDLAAKRIEGVVPAAADLSGLEDEAIVARLTAVRGVGRWTVQMFLMFTLARQDVWPHDDLGVRRGVAAAFGEDMAPKALAAWGEQWAPHRTAAAWYAWRAADVAKTSAKRDVTSP